MATQVKPAKDLYEEDLYLWSQAQAALLRAGRFDELDLENLIEEVEDVGGALKTLGAQPNDHDHGAPAQAAALAVDRRRGLAGETRSERSGRGLVDDLTPQPAPRALRPSCGTLSAAPGTMPTARCATTASKRAADALPPPAPTRSIRSPATGGRRRSYAAMSVAA